MRRGLQDSLWRPAALIGVAVVAGFVLFPAAWLPAPLLLILMVLTVLAGVLSPRLSLPKLAFGLAPSFAAGLAVFHGPGFAVLAVAAGRFGGALFSPTPRGAGSSVAYAAAEASLCALVGGAVAALLLSLAQDGVPGLALGAVGFVAASLAVRFGMSEAARSEPYRLAEKRSTKTRAAALDLAVNASIALSVCVLAADWHWQVAVFALPVFALWQYAAHRAREEHRLSDTIEGLALMLERAHPYTHRHAQRMAELGRLTGLRMGIPAERARLLGSAAVLHDLGKVAVDERVLEKPGPLSPSEYDHVKEHVAAGARILAGAEELKPIGEWIRHHHERMDGAGYPQGLPGEQIPLESRILAVVDAFDAMVDGNGVEKRPYRQPRSAEEAIAELRRCAGTQFDASVVDEFCRVVAERNG